VAHAQAAARRLRDAVGATDEVLQIGRQPGGERWHRSRRAGGCVVGQGDEGAATAGGAAVATPSVGPRGVETAGASEGRPAGPTEAAEGRPAVTAEAAAAAGEAAGVTAAQVVAPGH